MKVAGPEGFEPPTPWFVAKYSIQMSYGPVSTTQLATYDTARPNFPSKKYEAELVGS